jgi:hypothetical protein
VPTALAAVTGTLGTILTQISASKQEQRARRVPMRRVAQAEERAVALAAVAPPQAAIDVFRSLRFRVGKEPSDRGEGSLAAYREEE